MCFTGCRGRDRTQSRRSQPKPQIVQHASQTTAGCTTANQKCDCGNSVASPNPAHALCQDCYDKTRGARRGKSTAQTSPPPPSKQTKVQQPATTSQASGAQTSHTLFDMPRVQDAFNKAVAGRGLQLFQARSLAAIVRTAGRRGVPHSTIAQALESGQCVFADKCKLQADGKCKLHAAPGPAPPQNTAKAKQAPPAPQATASVSAPAVTDLSPLIALAQPLLQAWLAQSTQAASIVAPVVAPSQPQQSAGALQKFFNVVQAAAAAWQASA